MGGQGDGPLPVGDGLLDLGNLPVVYASLASAVTTLPSFSASGSFAEDLWTACMYTGSESSTYCSQGPMHVEEAKRYGT